MKTPSHAGFAIAFCVWGAGCAAPDASMVATATTAPRLASPYAARDAITIGKSTKADVMDAVGKGTVIRFESGFEVWAYKYPGDSLPKAGWLQRSARAGADKSASGNTELVVLFAPSGIVAKTRIREAPPPGEAQGK